MAESHPFFYTQNTRLKELYRYGSRGERLQELNGTRYVYNYSSQLEQMRTPKDSTTFVYDDKKRVVQKHGHSRVTAFSYNKYGLLEQVCLPDGRCITYTYDPLGRRSSKLVNGKVTEKYCWKDMLCLQAACTGKDEGHVVFNYPESGRNVLQPTSLSCNGKKYSLAYNHVGTLLAIADESGSIVHIEETDSFGRRLSHHKLASVAMLSFGGGQLDEDPGLVHFLFRDYDPATGFFIQQDPLGLRGGDVDVYGYCLDDPVNLVDPLGLATVPWYLPQSIVRNRAREYAPEFGYDVDCTNEELNELIEKIPDEAIECFRDSYDKRPDSGQELSQEEEDANYNEWRREKEIIDSLIDEYHPACIERKEKMEVNVY